MPSFGRKKERKKNRILCHLISLVTCNSVITVRASLLQQSATPSHDTTFGRCRPKIPLLYMSFLDTHSPTLGKTLPHPPLLINCFLFIILQLDCRALATRLGSSSKWFYKVIEKVVTRAMPWLCVRELVVVKAIHPTYWSNDPWSLRVAFLIFHPFWKNLHFYRWLKHREKTACKNHPLPCVSPINDATFHEISPDCLLVRTLLITPVPNRDNPYNKLPLTALLVLEYNFPIQVSNLS